MENINKSDQTNEIIKYLAFILRHKPHVARIKLNDDGWAETSKLTEALLKFKNTKISNEELIALINLKSKNSFSISVDGSLIKAKSGHTVLLGFSEIDKVPNILHINIAKNQMSTIFEKGLNLKSNERLLDKVNINIKSDTTNISINTAKAKIAKVKFYHRDGMFYAFHIPAQCLSFSNF